MRITDVEIREILEFIDSDNLFDDEAKMAKDLIELREKVRSVFIDFSGTSSLDIDGSESVQLTIPIQTIHVLKDMIGEWEDN